MNKHKLYFLVYFGLERLSFMYSFVGGYNSLDWIFICFFGTGLKSLQNESFLPDATFFFLNLY